MYMTKDCLNYIEIYINYLTGQEKNNKVVSDASEHIKNCTWCKANLSLFSTIIEETLKKRLKSSLSCNDIEKLSIEPSLIENKKEDIFNHLIYCKECRVKFIDKFVSRIEKKNSIFDKVIDIPDLKSPLLIIELHKKKNEIIEAIRNAEASIVKIKPDGGMRCDLTDLVEKRIESLPPYPDNVRNIIELIDIDADISDIAKEIKKDVSLSARILQISNSRFYRGRHPIDDVQRGISRIGLQVVSRIVKVFGIHSVIVNQAGKFLNGYNIPMKSFMDYSAMLAVIAMCLAPRYNRYQKKNEDIAIDLEMVAYTAGLVSNLGMIVLDRCIDKTFSEKLYQELSKGIDVAKIEKDLFGISHPEVSARILKRWNLSDSFIESVISHHSYDQPGSSILSDILFVSDTIAADFLRPTSRIKPFLHIVSSEEELFNYLPFSSHKELSDFYSDILLPTFEEHSIPYDKSQFIQ